MISTKEELKNVIELEKKGYDRNSLIRRYLRELRICEYYKNCGGGGKKHAPHLKPKNFTERRWGWV